MPLPPGLAYLRRRRVRLAKWESLEGARAFFEEWSLDSEPGEVAVELLGDVGLVPEP